MAANGRNKTIYVVSGFMRTGTSMMMAALKAGGMNISYNKKRDALAKEHSDSFYNPNENGLYELSIEEYTQHDFPKSYEGKVIKVLSKQASQMAVMPHGIRVVIMRRDSEEIRQSYLAFFGTQLKNVENLDRNMEDLKERLLNRKDVLSVDEFWYRDVIDNPLKHFKTLRRNKWPFSPAKASLVVNPKLCRYKKEDLTIGVI